MFYLGIIFTSIWGLILIVGTILTLKKDGNFMVLAFYSLIPALIGLNCLFPEACIDDVLDGKAQQVLYTTYGVTDNGDTIYCEKTYKIVWKDEWKHGCKH
jgi:hypothetical protein